MKGFRSVFLSSLFFLFSASFLYAEPANLAELIQKIELRRGTWTGLKAEIEIQFTTAKGKQASCLGKLVYHRLDERILLDCQNTKNKRVFALRTTDREFELYLPGHRTLYKGSIFTLEDSPAIESHLRAWDLYRAFKPMVIPLENSAAGPAENGLTAITVLRGEPPAKSREIQVSADGDILSETYYTFSGKASVAIKRSDFQTIGAETAGVPTVYPRQIQIISHKLTSAEDSTMETFFLFKKADFLTELPEGDFEMSLPPSTKVMVLEDDLT